MGKSNDYIIKRNSKDNHGIIRTMGEARYVIWSIHIWLCKSTLMMMHIILKRMAIRGEESPLITDRSTD